MIESNREDELLNNSVTSSRRGEGCINLQLFLCFKLECFKLISSLKQMVNSDITTNKALIVDNK
jgi:hypothetical protein